MGRNRNLGQVGVAVVDGIGTGRRDGLRQAVKVGLQAGLQELSCFLAYQMGNLEFVELIIGRIPSLRAIAREG